MGRLNQNPLYPLIEKSLHRLRHAVNSDGIPFLQYLNDHPAGKSPMELIIMKMACDRLLNRLNGLLTAVIITGSKADHVFFFHPFSPAPSFLIL